MLLKLAFLFFIGSVAGWVLELLFRRFFSSANPERKWINPGFCTGPYLPLYGSGLCLLYLIASTEELHLIQDPAWNRVLLFFFAAVCMTVIEYISGILALRVMKVRLWDYTGEWGNIQGIICPKFSLIWALLSAAYYFLVHPHILDALSWLAENLAFSFFIGLFFGIFIIDAAHSVNLTAKLRRFAKENDVIVRYEALKHTIRKYHDEQKKKYRFFAPLSSDVPLVQHLKQLIEK
ncbi:MAG: putative ABC transporter permease [Ruminococcus sp.]|nr:putative ABC transporter permease [Ruminococcus sp.]